jgi:prepilin-type N-terminal cleavage/methylation domain-containing protein
MRASSVVRGASGVTLLELIVVLGILGVILGVSGLALGALKAPASGASLRELQRVRTEAIRTGMPRTTHDARRTAVVRFLPDGRAIGPGVDPLTGAPSAK